MDKNECRKTFNSQAKLYHDARPGYPDKLFKDIIDYSGIDEHSELLEIGCGTGKATVPFLERGYSVTAIDIGDKMLEVFHSYGDFSKLKTQNISFEDFSSNIRFDVIYSATAFHWIPENVSFQKCAEYLKEKGTLAVFKHVHPKETDGFFAAVQKIYEKHVPQWAVEWKTQPHYSQKINDFTEKLNSSGYYENIFVKEYICENEYTAQQYIDLLNTFSPNLSLSKKKREAFHQDIYNMIKNEYNDRIIKKYLTILHCAQRKG